MKEERKAAAADPSFSFFNVVSLRNTKTVVVSHGSSEELSTLTMEATFLLLNADPRRGSERGLVAF